MGKTLEFFGILFLTCGVLFFPSSSASEMESAETGKKLFTAALPFQNGGPPCISCHNIYGVPFPGGGTLGSDLTRAYSKFGAAMNSVLATLPFPTMAPIYREHPLTPAEQRDLGAFFQKAGVQTSAEKTYQIFPPALGGFLILMILSWAIWRNRLRTVRKALVRHAAKTEGVGK